jgi:hypothetical protein
MHPSRLEASIFLTCIVPPNVLCYLTFLEIVFPWTRLGRRYRRKYPGRAEELMLKREQMLRPRIIGDDYNSILLKKSEPKLSN